jgi:predicted phage replisome organizer
MADVQWIKIYTNMVSNKKIKRIRTLPEGNNIVLIWVFLLAQAGESNKNGALYLTDAIPFRAEDLAIEFDFELSIIQLALITLEKFSMIEVFEDIIYIRNWNEYQNIEGLDKIREQTRKRVADCRERKKTNLLLDSPKTCAYCGRTADTIDHIIPKSKGGKDVSENVVSACKSCNSSKSNKDLYEFLNDSVVYTYQQVNFNLVLSNPVLMNYLEYDISTKVFSQKRYSNVTVTQGNATEEDKELDKEKDINNSGTSPRKYKIPPCLEEVKEYCKERNNNVDAVKWYDFYTSKAWMIGKNKMKDWKAAVRTWEGNKGKEEDKPKGTWGW